MKAPRCENCNKPLSALMRPDARYCSKRCAQKYRRWEARLLRLARSINEDRPCEVCGGELALGARPDARYCSARCRQRAYRQRR